MAGIARDVLFFLRRTSLQTLLDLDHDTLRNTTISHLEKCCATFRSMLQNSGGGKLGNSTSAWKQSLVSGYMSRRLM